MKSKLLLLIGFVFTFSLHLSAYSYQRVQTTVGPDYTIIHIKEATVPWDIYVMEIDLTKTDLKLKTGLAKDLVSYIQPDNTAVTRKEALTTMINRRTSMGENVLGGINADFFDMASGMQFNVTATGGVIAGTGITSQPHAALYTDENGVPYINLINMQHTMTIDGQNLAINNVNGNRWQDHLVIHNRFIGMNTSYANEWGTELLLEPQEEVYLNGTINYKVISKAAKVTRTSNSQIIASGHGSTTAVPFLNKAVAGTIVQISTSFTGIGNEKIYEMIGGWGHIVKGGANTAVASIVEEGSMIHENARHPRSAVGFNQNKSKLYFVAVDGRSDISKGMNLKELANFMIDELGIWEGLNFDGGGSTSLAAGNQIINNLSDGGQRPVANALLLVKETPSSVTQIEKNSDVLIFPNPASDLITIKFKEEGYNSAHIDFYTLDGRFISSKKIDSQQKGDKQHNVSISEFQSGVYFYKILIEDKSLSTGKIIIQ